MSISKSGKPIESLSAWKELAGPKNPAHWVDGRSAKEVARAWLEAGKGLPEEVDAVLRNHLEFGPVTDWHAEPEVRLRFDDFPGEPRNSDLVVTLRDAHGPYLMAVEAKADEPFGETIDQALSAALERFLANRRSNGMKRILQLSEAILGARAEGEPSVAGLRYQLLTACAGAVCEAERRAYSRVVVLVHEFITPKTRDDGHLGNAEDLARFVRRMSHGTVTSIPSGKMAGSFRVPGQPLFAGDVRLFLAKATRNQRVAGPLCHGAAHP